MSTLSPKYNSRKWLTKDTHSSGYVMCFYDQNCKNYNWRIFIRIADCSYTFSLNLDSYHKKDTIRFLDNFQKLVSLEIKYFAFHQYTFKLAYTPSFGYLIITEHFRALNRLIKLGRFLGKPLKPKILVRLHFDDETCTQKQWNQKLNILKNEIFQYQQFLVANQIL